MATFSGTSGDIAALSNTKNTAPGAVTATQLLDLPDLAHWVTPILDSTCVVPGGPLALTYYVANFGTIEAPASTTGIYLSTDSTITTADTLLTTDDVASLFSGPVAEERVTFAIPEALAAGTYYIGAILDYNNAITESNETNNATGVAVNVIANDFLASAATTGQISSGQSLAGILETLGDRDWFRVLLTSSTAYTFDLEGTASGAGTLADPYLYLYDAAGQLITWDDNAGEGGNSQLIFTPNASGVFFLGAGAFYDGLTGTYLLSVSGNSQPLPTATLFTDSNDSESLPASGGTFYALGGDDLMLGSASAEAVYGGTGHDLLYGNGGNDTLSAGAGEDIAVGGTGDDVLDGGDGGDVLSELFDPVNSGNDIFDGGNDVDIMYSAAGDDLVIGGTDTANNYGNLGDGNDTYNGSAGADVVVAGNGNDTVNGNHGDDALYGEAGNDTINGGSGIDLLSGSTGNDNLDGGANNDLVVGDEGNDTLRGGAGIDLLFGFADDDILNGGPDVDALYGGAGNDTFQVGGTGYFYDYIWDFEVSGVLGPSDSLVFQAPQFADATAVRAASVFGGVNTTITAPNGSVTVLVSVNIADILDEDILVNGTF